MAPVPDPEEPKLEAGRDGDPEWSAPRIGREIAAFNARHVILFRAAHGSRAGADFVRSCRAARPAFADVFATASSGGRLVDPDGMKKAVADHRLANAGDAFRDLLDREVGGYSTWRSARFRDRRATRRDLLDRAPACVGSSSRRLPDGDRGRSQLDGLGRGLVAGREPPDPDGGEVRAAPRRAGFSRN